MARLTGVERYTTSLGICQEVCETYVEHLGHGLRRMDLPKTQQLVDAVLLARDLPLVELVLLPSNMLVGRPSLRGIA